MAVIKHFVCYGCDNYEDVVLSDEDADILEPTVTCGGCGEEMLFESERYALDDEDFADSPTDGLDEDTFGDSDDREGSGAGDLVEGIALLFNQNGVRRSTSRGELALNLLAEDVVFFNEGEIAWDGQTHSVAGMQFNSAEIPEYPEIEQNPEAFAVIVAESMAAAETNPNLRVPLDSIHEVLHELLQNEDMTGMTFMNLAAWHMLKVRQIGDKYAVMVDANLIAGIPDAYNLIGELLRSLREAESLAGPFDIMFMSARNFDALEGVMIDDPVDGADDVEAFKVMPVDVV